MSEKSGMMKSHREMFCSRPRVYPSQVVSDYEISSVEDAVVDGRVLKKSVRKVVHPQDNMRGLKAVDFALENVIAAGALGTLKESVYGSVDASSFSDAMEPVMDGMVSSFDAAENNNAQNVEG